MSSVPHFTSQKCSLEVHRTDLFYPSALFTDSDRVECDVTLYGSPALLSCVLFVCGARGQVGRLPLWPPRGGTVLMTVPVAVVAARQEHVLQVPPTPLPDLIPMGASASLPPHPFTTILDSPLYRTNTSPKRLKPVRSVTRYKIYVLFTTVLQGSSVTYTHPLTVRAATLPLTVKRCNSTPDCQNMQPERNG
uniref:Uncharacterized protein n=1 Tax=Timema tahoe TaxID=61484 RepID=A0A7R9NWN9_9NEOP|nr:unnamed protein product [Timema tahoe]